MIKLNSAAILILAVALVGVVAFLRHEQEIVKSTSASRDQASLVRIPDFEKAMESLGYKAWGFQWNGGMVEATITSGPEGQNLWSGEGAAMLADLSNIAASEGKVVDPKSISGELFIMLEPQAHDHQTSDVSCRIAMTCRSRNGWSAQRSKSTHVQFAVRSGVEHELIIPVFGKWKIYESGSRGGDTASLYNLIQLRWISGGEAK
jgi:hypothetical protein